MMGNQNCHAEITFEDNVKWLARFRLARTASPPQEVRDCILRSEAATMTYLQQCTRIPVPNIFDWACESDPKNPLGIGYIPIIASGVKKLNSVGAECRGRFLLGARGLVCDRVTGYPSEETRHTLKGLLTKYN